MVNREEWLKLRYLPENIGLTEKQFQEKYSHKADVNYKETRQIDGLKQMKKSLRQVKENVDKKTVIW